MTDEQLVERLREHMRQVEQTAVYVEDLNAWVRAWLSCDVDTADERIDRLVELELLVERRPKLGFAGAGTGWPPRAAQSSYSPPRPGTRPP